MRLFWDNFISRAATGILASTENSEWPGRNIAHPWRSKYWETLGTAAPEYITFDLASALTPEALILLDHTLQVTDTSLRLDGDDNASFTSPQSTTLTWSAGPILLVTELNPERYWRVLFTKDAAAETRRIGAAFLGAVLTVAERPRYSGLQESHEDLSAQARSAGGQTQCDARPQYRRWAADFEAITETSKGALVTAFAAVGLHTPFYLQLDENASAAGLGEVLYVKLSRLPQFAVAGWDGAYFYDTKLEFEEQL